MQKTYIKTADGSTTIYVPELDETYHSRHGAINEAKHVFIASGLYFVIDQLPKQSALSVLEIGFGTGLNAFLTCLESNALQHSIHYTAVEAYPVAEDQLQHINFYNLIEGGVYKDIFYSLHQSDWEIQNNISDNFSLIKQHKKFEAVEEDAQYHLIYYDAFGPRVQPDLWGESIFSRMFKALIPGGVLVTYCAQGKARRAMQAVGFVVERLPGPPGKREMLRAVKPEF